MLGVFTGWAQALKGCWARLILTPTITPSGVADRRLLNNTTFLWHKGSPLLYDVHPRQNPKPRRVQETTVKTTAKRIKAHLAFGDDVGQVLSPREALLEGGLGGDVGGEPDRLAHIGRAGQHQEVLGRQRGGDLQAEAGRVEDGGGETEPLCGPQGGFRG